MTPAGSYIAQARQAGLLHEVKGVRLVAGTAREPVTGELRCLIEYCDPEGYRTSGLLARITDKMLKEFPGVTAVILRVRGSQRLAAPWRRMGTYVRYAAAGPGTSRTDGIGVRKAGAEDESLVREWIRRALADGYRTQNEGSVPDPAAIGRAADTVLGCRGRVSILALAGGVPVGHGTILEEFDDAAGRAYADLWDVLIEPGGHFSAARAALVGAAAAHAREAGVPLIGNVTHDVTDAGDREGTRVLDGLAAAGWVIDHADWQVRAA